MQSAPGIGHEYPPVPPVPGNFADGSISAMQPQGPMHTEMGEHQQTGSISSPHPTGSTEMQIHNQAHPGPNMQPQQVTPGAMTASGDRDHTSTVPAESEEYTTLITGSVLRGGVGAGTTSSGQRSSAPMGDVPARTVLEALQACVTANAKLPAVWKPSAGHGWQPLLWADYYDLIKRCASSFVALGVRARECINVCGMNSLEWMIAYMGAIFAGVVPSGVFTVHSSYTMRFQAMHCRARVVFVDSQENLDNYLSVLPQLPDLRAIIMLNGSPDTTIIARHGQRPFQGLRRDQQAFQGVLSWSDFLSLSSGVQATEVTQRMAATSAGQCVCLVYTSGTSMEHPRAVMLSHDNVLWLSRALSQGLSLTNRDTLLSFLPLAHILTQVLDVFAPCITGHSVHIAPPDAHQGKLVHTLRVVRPTVFVGIPAVWDGVVHSLDQDKRLQGKFGRFAKRKGLKGAAAMQAGQRKPRWYGACRRRLFRKLWTELGLDRCKYCCCTSAPMSRSSLDSLASIGIIVHELYGLTETSGAHSMSLPNNFKLGTCGTPLSGLECRLIGGPAEGPGEIALSGRNVFMGYLGDPAATFRTFNSDGLFKTGDIGAFDGPYLTIKGRISDTVTLENGTSVLSPSAEVVVHHELQCMSHVVVIGQGRPFLSVLMALKQDALTSKVSPDAVQWAKDRHVVNVPEEPQTLVESQEFMMAVNAAIMRANEHMAGVAVKKFAVVPTRFCVEGGELTPSGKLRRSFVEAKYDFVIRGMYGQPPSQLPVLSSTPRPGIEATNEPAIDLDSVGVQFSTSAIPPQEQFQAHSGTAESDVVHEYQESNPSVAEEQIAGLESSGQPMQASVGMGIGLGMSALSPVAEESMMNESGLDESFRQQQQPEPSFQPPNPRAIRRFFLAATLGNDNLILVDVEPIEKALVDAAPFLEDAVVIGEGRPYLTAILSFKPDPALPDRLHPEMISWLMSQGSAAVTAMEAKDDGNVRAAVIQAVTIVNDHAHDSGHTIRKFVFAPAGFRGTEDRLADGGLNRALISQRYCAAVDELYEGEPAMPVPAPPHEGDASLTVAQAQEYALGKMAGQEPRNSQPQTEDALPDNSQKLDGTSGAPDHELNDTTVAVAADHDAPESPRLEVPSVLTNSLPALAQEPKHIEAQADDTAQVNPEAMSVEMSPQGPLPIEPDDSANSSQLSKANVNISGASAGPSSSGLLGVDANVDEARRREASELQSLLDKQRRKAEGGQASEPFDSSNLPRSGDAQNSDSIASVPETQSAAKMSALDSSSPNTDNVEPVQCGVGIAMAPNPANQMYIARIAPDGSAGRQGQLSVGDLILAVDGHNVLGMTGHQITQFIVGPQGSAVNIEALHGAGHRLNVTLQRQPLPERAQRRVRKSLALSQSGSGSTSQPPPSLLLPSDHQLQGPPAERPSEAAQQDAEKAIVNGLNEVNQDKAIAGPPQPPPPRMFHLQNKVGGRIVLQLLDAQGIERVCAYLDNEQSYPGPDTVLPLPGGEDVSLIIRLAQGRLQQEVRYILLGADSRTALVQVQAVGNYLALVPALDADASPIENNIDVASLEQMCKRGQPPSIQATNGNAAVAQPQPPYMSTEDEVGFM